MRFRRRHQQARPPEQNAIVEYPDFISQRLADPVVRFRARTEAADASPDLTRALRAVPWSQLTHAYGPAGDVPALLHAVALGEEDVRREAWWELWGNVHHQGTVYPATVLAVPFLADTAANSDHPDAVQALEFLRRAAVGDGAAAQAVREAVREQLPRHLEGWVAQPELWQRALLLLVAAFPEVLAEHPNLDTLVPDVLRDAWADLTAADGNPNRLDYDNDEAMDRNEALEAWALTGMVSDT